MTELSEKEIYEAQEEYLRDQRDYEEALYFYFLEKEKDYDEFQTVRS